MIKLTVTAIALATASACACACACASVPAPSPETAHDALATAHKICEARDLLPPKAQRACDKLADASATAREVAAAVLEIVPEAKP